jgi:NCS1 family nucleobase:cation symporter-1
VAGFVNAVGAVMGPLLGVILVDYYLIARQRVDVAQLYVEKGAYRFSGGWNLNALVATAIGGLFSSVLPHVGSILPAWWSIYGWFFGVAIGGLVYFGMERLRPRRPLPATAPEPQPAPARS